MFQKLEAVKEKYDKLSLLLSDPAIISNQTEYQRYAKEQAEISKIVEKYIEFKKIIKELEENEKLLKEEVNDEELKELARTEIEELETKKEKVEDELKILLIPKDPNDGKNIFLEIRAGTGGEEAGLFVADMFRVYTKYAEKHKWRIEIMTSNPTGVGGFKEIIALIEGKGVYSRLKFESGVHRVQRVPATEAGGRIHTSAITIAILPEAEEVDVDIDPNDLRIDVYRSSGPGGQSVNTTDSAVRITHLPTGIVVSCQDEKSQHKNKSKGLRILRARLLDKFQAEQQAQISQDRKKQVGSGDRSERIRTYNFPQGRVTDHRIGLTLYKLETILEGELDGIIDPLITHYQTEILKEI